MSWLPVGRRYAGRAKTTWRRMTEKEGSEQLGWKSWKEDRQVTIKRSEWPRKDKALGASTHRLYR